MFPNLSITDEGKALQVKALYGNSIIFTKVALGDGSQPTDISAMTQLNHQLYVCEIDDFENNGTTGIIHWSLDSQRVTDNFQWTEYGIFAKDAQNNEVLYAYAYDTSPQTIYSGNNSAITQIETDVNVAFGNAENVTAVIGEYSAYAEKARTYAHIDSRNNPHVVTAEQVGLGNVDNVSTNEATPTFTEAETLSNINSGERATIIFGKIKKAISSLIAHISARNNPHAVTIAQIGAAATSHNHSASNITSGVLPENRGGTGYNNYEDFTKDILSSLLGNGFSGLRETGPNFNEFTTGGVFYVSYSSEYPMTNGPSTGYLSGSLLLAVLSRSNTIIQFAVPFGTPGTVFRIYIRQYSGSSWGSWQCFKTE